MRNDRVPIPVLHLAHNAKCFSLCVYSYFHPELSDNPYFITKMPTFGLYEYKVGGWGCAFNRKRGHSETD